jgi:translation initiation factor IF-2
MTQKSVKNQTESKKFKPPVVVILGHVNHGKTTLLDFIRKSHIAEKEAGGITQHIGAYQIEHSGKKITFIDTPGHEAFTTMRSRGAKVADIAVLVIDTTQGVQNQTKEAIQIIKEVQIPFIVALNKTDLPAAQPEWVKDELLKYGVICEDRGGNVPSLSISAKTGKGVNDLLELILLIAEMEKLEADYSKPAAGVVIEAKLDSKRGPIATLIIEEGCLKIGDIVGTSSTFGKIRLMEDSQKKVIDRALAGDAVLVIGFEEVPLVGQEFLVYPDLETAQKNVKSPKVFEISSEFSKEKEEPTKPTLNLIIKADFIGSLEAIQKVISQIPQDKVSLKIVFGGIGDITENDIKMANVSRAKIIGFRVKANAAVRKMAENFGLDIKMCDIIYELAQEIRNLMERILKPELVKKIFGRIKLLAIFKVQKKRQIVGGRVIEGEIVKNLNVEVFRGEEKIGEGKILNIQKNKQEIKKGLKGDEIGILYEGEEELKEGDILIAFKTEKVKVGL